MPSSPRKRPTSAIEGDDDEQVLEGLQYEHDRGPSPKKRSRHLSATPPQTPSRSPIKSRYSHPSQAPYTHQGIPSQTLVTPYSFPLKPSDSPTNPFGRTRRFRLTRMLPPPTKFAHHFPLRFQLVRGDEISPYMGGVYRIVQVPLNYTFVHLRCLIMWVFSRPSEVSEAYKRRSKRNYGMDLQESEGYWFDVRKGAKTYSMTYKPGQVRGGATCVKLSKVRDPCRFRLEKDGFVALEDEDEEHKIGTGTGSGSDDDENPFEVKRRLEPVALPGLEEEYEEGTSLVRIDAGELYGQANEDDEEERDEDDADWRWEPEDEFTLANAWPTGPDMDRVIVYHHDSTTQVHITLNTLPIERRRGTSNTPYVFTARGRVSLYPQDDAETYESGGETSGSEHTTDLLPPSLELRRHKTEAQRATQPSKKEGSGRLAWLYRGRGDDRRDDGPSSPTPSHRKLTKPRAPILQGPGLLNKLKSSGRGLSRRVSQPKQDHTIDVDPYYDVEGLEEQDNLAEHHEGEENTSITLPTDRWNNTADQFESFLQRYNEEEEREERRERRRKRKSMSRSTTRSLSLSEGRPSPTPQKQVEDTDDARSHNWFEVYESQHGSSSSLPASTDFDTNQIPFPSQSSEVSPRKPSKPRFLQFLDDHKSSDSVSQSLQDLLEYTTRAPVKSYSLEASSSKENVSPSALPQRPSSVSSLIFPTKHEVRLESTASQSQSYTYHSSTQSRTSFSSSPEFHFDQPPVTSPVTSPEHDKTLTTPGHERDLPFTSYSEPRAYASESYSYPSSYASSTYRDAYSSPIRGRTISNATSSSSMRPHNDIVELTMRMVNEFKFTPAPAKAVRRKIERVKRRLMRLSRKVKEEGRRKRKSKSGKGKSGDGHDDDDTSEGSYEESASDEDKKEKEEEIHVKVEPEEEPQVDLGTRKASVWKGKGKAEVKVNNEPVDDPVPYRASERRKSRRLRRSAVEHEAETESRCGKAGGREEKRSLGRSRRDGSAPYPKAGGQQTDGISKSKRKGKGRHAHELGYDKDDDAGAHRDVHDHRGLRDLRKFGIISEPEYHPHRVRDADDDEEQEIVKAVQGADDAEDDEDAYVEPSSEVGECSLGQVIGAERARIRRQFGTRKGRTWKQSMYYAE
ncbi:hypothetical protein AX16_004019 [Volvariella volvacea WC 439]|nr:hypothetical protein AX16_004019 [Volvariella volvacea WC 439]